MNRFRSRVRLCTTSTALLTGLTVAALFQRAQAAPAADSAPLFSFQDYLNHDWTNELVRVPLSPEVTRRLNAKPALLDSDGAAVPYQVTAAATGAAPVISFLANVKAGGNTFYQFGAPGTAGAAPTTDLKLEENDDTIQLTNRFIGISLRKSLQPGQGPVAQIRLASGKWIGGSRLTGKLTPTAYTAKVVDSGPVYDEVECRTEFAGGESWVLDFRLDANEPVVVVRDNMALGADEAGFSLSLSDNFTPDKMFFRAGMDGPRGRIGTNLQDDFIQPGSQFTLEPWVHWWQRYEDGPVFSVYDSNGPDMLSVGAGFASLWVDPTMDPAKRAAPAANLVKDEQGLHLDFDLKNGQRQWMIMTPDKDASLASLTDPAKLNDVSLPHALLIKHGQFPLNVVKDYILDWPSDREPFPHLLINATELARYRAAHAQDAPLQDQDIDACVGVRPINQFSMPASLGIFFRTGNERVRKYLVQECIGATQDLVDNFLKQPEIPYGAAPHHFQVLGTTPLVLDAALASPEVTPELRKKLLAQIAFCGYAVNRPDFWDESRGFSANPNMTTSVLGYEVSLGSLISTHPMAKTWVTNALAGLKSQLYNWSDANGGWLEAPHYAMVSYDAILGSALIAHNAGISDMVYDPRMRKVMDWFGKWSTPPDSRFGGFRHLPPVGNTYINEATGEFGIMASVWKDKDPAYAGEMEWMYHQEHSWPTPGIGGGYPTLAGYRQMLSEYAGPEKAPQWGSELFPQTGVVFRSDFPSNRENSLLLLAGSFGGWRSHWNDDSGSVTLWGKGRILCDDFGYYGDSPAEDHSLPMSPEIAQRGIFDVSSFTTTKDFDYVTGSRGAPGAWRRQIAFVKNQDPAAANYFVFADTFKTAAPAVWRLWFTADTVTPGPAGALVSGKDDVDTDVFFATGAPADLKTETKTRTAGSGIHPDGSMAPMATTQIGLIASAPTSGAMTYVLYPRLKTEAPPTFTALAGGSGIKIQTATETDYVFLSTAPVNWQEGDLAFSGTVGSILLRGKQTVLNLGEAGTVTAGRESLTAKQSESKEFTK